MPLRSTEIEENNAELSNDGSDNGVSVHDLKKNDVLAVIKNIHGDSVEIKKMPSGCKGDDLLNYYKNVVIQQGL